MKRVLLTGATGFVGRQCIPPLLNRGYEIHAISSRAPDENISADVCWHQVDLLRALDIQRLLVKISASHLLHCAWYAEPTKYWEAPENYEWVRASTNLFTAFSRSGGERAVGVGSCAEYDWNHGRCSEFATPLNPDTTYGVCKHKAQIA